jgi:hypothetical protein
MFGASWRTVVCYRSGVKHRAVAIYLDSERFRTGPRTASAPRGRLIMSSPTAWGCGVSVDGWVMITSMECRERAVECRQMAKRAPNMNVQAALVDMARTWERLALQNA